ncbi:hypothetical protein [Chromobacterium sp. Rain0013]|uniref:hypothetical protein n=1 Tax=Chromobacterium sp. Rain0013 TaxID=2292447 RepID=UPI0018894C83|nr:hypothetical protein [Chromobacterium sp. Rain0013]
MGDLVRNFRVRPALLASPFVSVNGQWCGIAFGQNGFNVLPSNYAEVTPLHYDYLRRHYHLNDFGGAGLNASASSLTQTTWYAGHYPREALHITLYLSDAGGFLYQVLSGSRDFDWDFLWRAIREMSLVANQIFSDVCYIFGVAFNGVYYGTYSADCLDSERHFFIF